MAIKAEYYIHEADQSALESLQVIPGFERLMKWFMKEWSERQGKLRNMSSYIRIDENQLPKYHEMLVQVSEKLGIEKPELYLMMDVRPNAFTSGDTEPYIVITSGLLDVLPEELIPTILAHECGHIACHHVLYRTMGSILLGGTAGTLRMLPLGTLFTLPLQIAFFYWMRCSEYSADRAAVLCDGSADKMAEVCMRLAGFDRNITGELNKEAFMEQAKEYRKMTSDSPKDKTMEFYMLSSATHPFMADRALECSEWAKTDQFRQILDGTYVPKKDTEEKTDPDAVICEQCGTANRKDAAFCKKCGRPLKEVLRCENCGELLHGDEAFCPHCGKPLK